MFNFKLFKIHFLKKNVSLLSVLEDSLTYVSFISKLIVVVFSLQEHFNDMMYNIKSIYKRIHDKLNLWIRFKKMRMKPHGRFIVSRNIRLNISNIWQSFLYFFDTRISKYLCKRLKYILQWLFEGRPKHGKTLL